MATRRTTTLSRPSTRTASRSTHPSTTSGSSSRPARSNAPSRAESVAPNEERHEPTPAHPTRSSRAHPGKEDVETNIRVVIRCRRRSDREVQENSPIIVSTTGRKGTDITIETAAPSTGLGVVTLPPTRTYPFDLVFGPEADQSDIYHDVVSPMLEEVLQGYNCTLFAYGQTGTGKTYTMQGDLTLTHIGNPSAQAGMIPRVLFRLFHHLESSKADYSVKISFVELYNEELRDLLAPELAAPAGSTQPMGMGAKDGAAQGGLKIFDDSSKKGVFIQGLEEFPVKDVSDALTLLVKGSERRQIAATKFNDHSSRSHSIFSVTVHTKETSNIGDDLLKVGKLNLVDLAGSENIGRSGAENKRAREAGMINQSLLTLGRVINALVDRSSHVPYRESKLTRLLQDSLGGRTKTCIIATISPARSNMEETLSTLDYAIRAKSIRNKPELNQRMNRNALLKEYIGEIERLKADVLAAREKNGIFFSEETWTQMSAEQELKDTEMQEAKKEVEILESQLRNVREEFEQCIAILVKRDGELKETQEKLEKKETELVETEGHLKVVKGALEEEVVVRQAYQENETVLDDVASGLKNVAHQSVDDLGRLFGKLDRKSTVLTSNVRAVSTHTRRISAESREASSKLDEFTKVSKQLLSSLKQETEQYRVKELEILSGISTKINQQVEKVQDALKLIRQKEENTDEVIDVLQSTVTETQEGISVAFKSWADTLNQHCEKTCKQAEASTSAGYSTIEKAFKSLGSMAETLLQEAQEHITAERKSLQDAKTMAETSSQAEIARLQEQNELLTQALAEEVAKADSAKDELVKRMVGLFDAFAAERARSLGDLFSEIAESNEAAQAGMEKLGKDQSRCLEAVIGKGLEWGGSLDKKLGESKRLRDGGLKAANNVSSIHRDSLSNMRTSVAGSVGGFSSDIQRRIQQSNVVCSEACDDMRSAKRARLETTEALATELQSGYRHLQRGVASSSRNVETLGNQTVSEITSLSSATETYQTAAVSHISEIYQTNQSLSDMGAREDMPTGTTPRKRNWEFNDHWSLTKNREVLLRNWKQHSTSASSPLSESIPAEHLPPEEDEEGDAMEDIAADDEDALSSPGDDLDETITMETPPPVHSLRSSSSSSVNPTPELKKPAPSWVQKSSGIPTKGTLTERSTNVLAGRPSRRTIR